MNDVIFEPGLFTADRNPYETRVKFDKTIGLFDQLCSDDIKESMHIVIEGILFYEFPFANDPLVTRTLYRYYNNMVCTYGNDGVTVSIDSEDYYQDEKCVHYILGIASEYIREITPRQPDNIFLLMSGHEDKIRRFLGKDEVVIPQCVSPLNCVEKIKALTKEDFSLFCADKWPTANNKDGAKSFYQIMDCFMKQNLQSPKCKYCCTQRFLSRILRIPNAGKNGEQMTKVKFVAGLANRLVTGFDGNLGHGEKLSEKTKGTSMHPPVPLYHFSIDEAERIIFFYDSDNTMILVDYLSEHTKNEEKINVNPEQLLYYYKADCMSN